jgi:hypothetical protein
MRPYGAVIIGDHKAIMAKRIRHVNYLKIVSTVTSLKSGGLDHLNYPKSWLMASIEIKTPFTSKIRGY